jgi:hypothetical protein
MLDVGGETPRNAFGGHVANGIPNLDTIPSFSGHFNVKGLNRSGQVQNQWLTNFVWRTAPAWGHHGDQRADNPVTVQLLGQNGQVFLYSNATQYESNVADSPAFSPAPGRAVRL